MPTVLPHYDVEFVNQSLYVTGHMYANCSFRGCTLIVRELPTVGAFANCRFESCLWQLHLNVRDRRVWQTFLERIAPFIGDTLPPDPVA
jgi:hypothetical protein